MPNAEALIFDFNGTLFWDTAYNRESWNWISLTYRHRPYTEEEANFLNGRPSGVIVRFFLGNDTDDGTVSRIIEEKEAHYRALCWQKGKPVLAPGSDALIRKAYGLGIPMAIATGAPKSNVDAYRKWFPSLSLFGNNILLDDGTHRRGKPAPDIFLEALNLLGKQGNETIVFEDSVAGIRAAKAAGITRIYAIGSPLSDKAGVEKENVPILPDFTFFSIG